MFDISSNNKVFQTIFRFILLMFQMDGVLSNNDLIFDFIGYFAITVIRLINIITINVFAYCIYYNESSRFEL